MELIVYTAKSEFESFLREQLDLPFLRHAELVWETPDANALHLLHITSLGTDCYGWIKRFSAAANLRIAVCADIPQLREMLECARLGARAYCNSHMATLHYYQLLQMVENGQSWYPPQMLEETFRLAQEASRPEPTLESLTDREKEIALAVADGKSNRQIADLCEISEPTVKTHLSNIFRKLELKDRVGLALYVNRA